VLPVALVLNRSLLKKIVIAVVIAALPMGCVV